MGWLDGKHTVWEMLLRLASMPAMLSALHSTIKSGFARDQPRPASRPLPLPPAAQALCYPWST